MSPAIWGITMNFNSIRQWIGVLILGLGLGFGIERAVANTGGRVALVVGNSSYIGLKTLFNPPNDAAAVASTLRKLGYQLVGKDGHPTEGPLLNLDQESLIEAVDAFAQAARGQEIAFLYYAGHGFQDGRSSYLVPVDVPKPKQSLEILKSRSLALDGVIGKIDGKAQLVVAVFDACREIPELDAVAERNRSSGLTGEGSNYHGLIPTRGGIRQGATATSRLIAYAGAAGQLVKDGTSQHSPYTELLLSQFRQQITTQKNMELTAFFQSVAWEFRDRQEGQQPLLEVAAKPGTFYLLPEPVAVMQVPAPAPVPVIDFDLKQWESAERCGTAACFRAYLKAHPQGRFVTLAKAQVDRLIPPVTPANPPLDVNHINLPETQQNQSKPQLDTVTLAVESNVTGSIVKINGRPQGSTNLKLKLKPGVYSIEVSKSGYKTFKQFYTVTLTKEHMIYAQLELRPTSPRVKHKDQSTVYKHRPASAPTVITERRPVPKLDKAVRYNTPIPSQIYAPKPQVENPMEEQRRKAIETFRKM